MLAPAIKSELYEQSDEEFPRSPNKFALIIETEERGETEGGITDFIADGYNRPEPEAGFSREALIEDQHAASNRPSKGCENVISPTNYQGKR